MTQYWFTIVLGITIFTVTFVPLIILALSLGRSNSRICSYTSLILSAVLGLFLFSHVHNDIYSGLDTAGYEGMASAFTNGRALIARDDNLAVIPKEDRIFFSFYNFVEPKFTRDFSFRVIDNPENRTFSSTGEWTKPWFLPTLPLAASVLGHIGLSVLFFVPIVATVWIFFLFSTLLKINFVCGLISGFGLLIATAFPAFYLRGSYPEGVGAMLVSCAVMYSIAKPRKNLFWIGLLLVLSLAYHRTAGIIGFFAFFFLLIIYGNWKTTCALAGGAILASVLDLKIANICGTYGTSFLSDHETILSNTVFCTAFICVVIAFLFALHSVRVRQYVTQHRCVRNTLIIFLLSEVAVWGVFLFAQFDNLKTYMRLLFLTLGLPATVLLLLSAIICFRCCRRIFDKILLAAICLLIPVMASGIGKVAGIWNFRRFLPLALVALPILAVTLTEFFSERKDFIITYCHSKHFALVVCVFSVLCFIGASLYNLLSFPLVYCGISGKGSDAICSRVSNAVNPRENIVFFDYAKHSVPFALDLKNKVYGIAPWAYEHVGRGLQLLTKANTNGNAILIVSSYTPVPLEDNFKLKYKECIDASYETVHAKYFFPAVKRTIPYKNVIMELQPLTDIDDVPTQDKTFDGGPIGLRGQWCTPKGNGQWSREGSGIIGPIPNDDGNVELTLNVSWPSPDMNAWPVQKLHVTSPWGTIASADIYAGKSTNVIISIQKQPSMIDNLSFTGIYTFSVDTPFNPEKYGIKGFTNDLGVVFHHAKITLKKR